MSQKRSVYGCMDVCVDSAIRFTRITRFLHIHVDIVVVGVVFGFVLISLQITRVSIILPSKTHTPPFAQPFCSWMLLCCVCVCTLVYDANHHRLHTVDDNNSSSGSRSNEKEKPSRFVVSCLSCNTKKRTQHGDMFL